LNCTPSAGLSLADPQPNKAIGPPPSSVETD
jgi:hypothetical protein